MAKRNRYTKDFLEPLIAQSVSWAEVCRRAGVAPATGTQSHITKVAKIFNLDYSHFLGTSWNKGKRLPCKRPIEYYLTTNSTTKSHMVRQRLIADGIKEAKCEICGISEWNGRPAPLELDHINSDHCDNRLENLQIICANCHAQITNLRREERSPPAAREQRRKIKIRTNACVDCGVAVLSRSKRCVACHLATPRAKIQWPPIEELQQRLAASNYSALARELGVTDNAIRRHIQRRLKESCAGQDSNLQMDFSSSDSKSDRSPAGVPARIVPSVRVELTL